MKNDDLGKKKKKEDIVFNNSIFFYNDKMRHALNETLALIKHLCNAES